jgi:hypothetical protein
MVYLVALSDTWDKTALKARMNDVMNKNLIRFGTKFPGLFNETVHAFA